jgi:ribosomal protein S18 acetylase RimI-like enzyme
VRLAPLRRGHTEWLSQSLLRAPAHHAFLITLLRNHGSADIQTHAGTLYGVFDGRRPVAAYWVGGTIVAMGATPATNAVVAEMLNARGRWNSSLIGEAGWVMDLAARLRWGTPRGVRPEQPLLVCEGRPQVPPHPEVRTAHLADLEAVFAAAVEMFTEEVGFSPVEQGSSGYLARVRGLIDNRSTLILTSGTGPDGGQLRDWPAAGLREQVVFKADLGVSSPYAVQIQGVWTHPDFRGRGIASSAMVAVSSHVLTHVAPVVSLYANAFNAPALRVYEKAGYVQRGTFATVMY